MVTNYTQIKGKLDEFIRKYYTNQVVRGLLYATGLGLVFYLGAAIAEYFAHFDTAIRTLLFYGFLAVNGYIVSRYIAVPLLKLYRLGAVITYEKSAEIIGSHFAEIQDKLLNVLQLQQSTESSLLIEAAINQKIRELRPIPFTSAVDIGENKKYLKYALFPLLILLLILFSAPGIITDSTKRLVNHSVYFEREAPFKFEIENQELKAVQQHDFELHVKLTGSEVPSSVFIVLNGNEYKLEKVNTVEFRYLFKNLQETTPFNLAADGFKSKQYQLIILPNPVLLNFTVSLDYPPYLGKQGSTIKNTGDLVIPEGTKVTWNFSTRNTSVLRMSFGDTSLTLSESASDFYSYKTRIMADRHYSVTTANEFMHSMDSVFYSISVIPDQYPTIDVDDLKDSVSQKIHYFKGEVKDDYGFTSLTFNYRFINKAGIDSGEAIQGSPAPGSSLTSIPLPVNKNSTMDRFFYTWDLNVLPVASGDAIEYYFEIKDNDGVHGPKAARSQKMIFKAPTADEIAENTDKNNSKVKEDLKETIAQAKELEKQLGDLNRKVLEKKDLSWEEKKKMEELLHNQDELQKKVESIKNENHKDNEQESEFKQVDRQIAEKQQQLEDLLKEVLTPEMKEKMEEIQKLMSQLDKNKVQNELDKMQQNAKDVEKELDRTLEAFKRMEVAQKLQENIEKMNALQKEQEELAKKSEEKKSDPQELEKKQEELNSKMDDFKKDMTELDKKNKELEEPNKLENTDKKQDEISQDMKKSETSLQEGKKNMASGSQKKAAGKMQQLSQQMQQMQQNMEQEETAEDANSLREILHNLIQLSFDQEALMVNLKKIRIDNPQYPGVARDQKKLQDDSKMIEDSLLALSKRQPSIKSTVNREISAINMSMEKAISALAERQVSEAAGRQQFSMTSINNLALMLNEALQNMQAQAMSQKGGGGSCRKPGGKGKKPAMSDLRKMQEQLNAQLEKMKEGMDKGKKGQQGKEGNNGSGGNQGMSEQLAKLAAQQAYIREQMQKAAEGKLSGADAAKKMDQTETDLVNKMITQETIKRQQEILNKLLDFEKAEKERDQDEKRESTESKKDFVRNPDAFLEYNRLKEKETELLKTVPPTLNPFYKSKVNDYFNSFE